MFCLTRRLFLKYGFLPAFFNIMPISIKTTKHHQVGVCLSEWKNIHTDSEKGVVKIYGAVLVDII